MKGRCVALVGVSCIAVLVASGAFAGKPDKPEKPGRSKPECILFSGDLQSAGDTTIVGCCPNAGPMPAYDMTLTTGTPVDGTYHGYVFMNSYGRPAPYEGYKFQFLTWNYEIDDPGDGDIFFEIRGGVMEGGKKKDDLPFTVTFENATATGWIYFDGYPEVPAIEIPIPNVNFVLLRDSDLSYCE